MMTWLLKKPVEEDLGVSLDDETKMIKMALIHDLVEINAGDIEAWDDEGRKNIISDEHEAIEFISDKYFDGEKSEIKMLWLEHDELKTIESKLVKACDQLCPLIYRVVFNCNYSGTGVDEKKLDDLFLKIVDFSEVTLNLYKELREEIKSKGLFDSS